MSEHSTFMIPGRPEQPPTPLAGGERFDMPERNADLREGVDSHSVGSARADVAESIRLSDSPEKLLHPHQYITQVGGFIQVARSELLGRSL